MAQYEVWKNKIATVNTAAQHSFLIAHLIKCAMFAILSHIRESVDSLCRDGTDAPIKP